MQTQNKTQSNQTVKQFSKSAVMSRLVEEVRVEKHSTVGDRYDRVHNRHNR